MLRIATSFAVVVALLLGACATQRSPFTGFFKGYDNCRAQYEAMDARVEAAGVRDGTYYRVPGFPYLRTDRMLASFRHEVKNLNDISEWVRRMRELDQESRDTEYANLGINDLELSLQRDRFLNCGRVLAAIELDNPRTWARMVDAVVPAEEYSSVDRFLGLYPLRAGAMRSRAAALTQAQLVEYQQPLADPPAGAVLRLWSAKPVEDLSILNGVAGRILTNDLGFPGLVGSEWRALAEYNAPHLWIETANEADLPAAPVFLRSGLSADVAQPKVYYQYSFARFGGRTMAQISYFVWFRSPTDAATAPIDGFIWRVTLDEHLDPLIYESLHGSGRDHRWYPVQPLQVRVPANGDGEPEFIAPVAAPAVDATLRIASGAHDVRRVVEVEQAGTGGSGQYELHLYDELYTMERPEGGTRSLFGADGLVAGTHGIDPLASLASGILQPGTLRQYGHHAIAHVGRRYFDDPYLLEASFVAPPAKPRLAPQASLAGAH